MGILHRGRLCCLLLADYFYPVFNPLASIFYFFILPASQRGFSYVPGTEDIARVRLWKIWCFLLLIHPPDAWRRTSPGQTASQHVFPPHFSVLTAPLTFVLLRRYFTLYAYNSTEQGRSMTRDLKMGQYTKLPPRVTFTMQCLGAVIGALINYVLMRSIIAAHRDILTSVQGTVTWCVFVRFRSRESHPNCYHRSGAGVQSFNSDAIAWGALAKQLYSPSSTYGVSSSASLVHFEFKPHADYSSFDYYRSLCTDPILLAALVLPQVTL